MRYIGIHHQHYPGWSKGQFAGPANISWEYIWFSVIFSIQSNLEWLLLWIMKIFHLVGWCHRLHLQSSVYLRSAEAPRLGWTEPQSGQHQNCPGTLVRPLSAVLGRRFGNLWRWMWSVKSLGTLGESPVYTYCTHTTQFTKVLYETKDPKTTTRQQNFQVIFAKHSYKSRKKQWQRGSSDWSCRWERCCRSCCSHCLREERPLERSCHRWCQRNLRRCLRRNSLLP